LRVALQELALRNLTVRGSLVGSLGELAETVALAKSGRLRRVPIIKKPLGAAAVNEALDGLAQGRVPGRIVLTA
jgi:alcohol dehydrogenase, propanol-preferring